MNQLHDDVNEIVYFIETVLLLLLHNKHLPQGTQVYLMTMIEVRKYATYYTVLAHFFW